MGKPWGLYIYLWCKTMRGIYPWPPRAANISWKGNCLWRSFSIMSNHLASPGSLSSSCNKTFWRHASAQLSGICGVVRGQWSKNTTFNKNESKSIKEKVIVIFLYYRTIGLGPGQGWTLEPGPWLGGGGLLVLIRGLQLMWSASAAFSGAKMTLINPKILRDLGYKTDGPQATSGPPKTIFNFFF